MKAVVPLIARLFISPMFIFSGTKNLIQYQEYAQRLTDRGVTLFPELFHITGALLLVVGGISVLLGYEVRLGAFMIILFLVPATLLFHFDLSDPRQNIQLLKNTCMTGALLMLIAFGAGRFSLDRERF